MPRISIKKWSVYSCWVISSNQRSQKLKEGTPWTTKVGLFPTPLLLGFHHSRIELDVILFKPSSRMYGRRFFSNPLLRVHGLIANTCLTLTIWERKIGWVVRVDLIMLRYKALREVSTAEWWKAFTLTWSQQKLYPASPWAFHFPVQYDLKLLLNPWVAIAFEQICKLEL